MGAITYLLQVSGCMAIFYLFYYLLLNRLTFFTINRYYLLATLALSFIIPLLTIPVEQVQYVPITQQQVYINAIKIYTAPTHSTGAVVQPAVDWLQVLKLVYLLAVM